MTAPGQFELRIRPRERYQIIDVRSLLEQEYPEALAPFRFATYCSHHTTAGYLSPKELERLDHRRDRVDPFVSSFRAAFPKEAGYRHDDVDSRTDLSDAQRKVEPKNADSHLTFISSGLTNCATHEEREGRPVYLIELDGIGPLGARERQTTVVGFQTERVVETFERSLPALGHEVDALNLRDGRFGLLDEIEDHARRLGIGHGRVDISLAHGERHAGLTVNEYETYLMRHDLPDLLRNPMRFVAQRARSAWRDPRAVPHKTLDYIRYDLILWFNRAMDSLGAAHTGLEKFLVRLAARPARRFLNLRRDMSFLISERTGPVVLGRYQSPILIQWLPSPSESRRLVVSLVSYS
jgi:thiamine phosphate synthase YjbQ (UPF0047 family)